MTFVPDAFFPSDSKLDGSDEFYRKFFTFNEKFHKKVTGCTGKEGEIAWFGWPALESLNVEKQKVHFNAPTAFILEAEEGLEVGGE